LIDFVLWFAMCCYHRSLYIKTLCKTISYVTSRPSTRQWSLISLHQDPLRGYGHWFLMSHRGLLRGNGHRSLYIKTLCVAMLIDFFVTLRPSAMQYIDLFTSINFVLYIKALCEAIVIDIFTSRPSTIQGNGHWFLMSHRGPLRGNGHRSLYIKTLCEAMVIDLFTSRPSAWQWSLISLSHRGLLRCNGHWFIYMKALYETMIIDFVPFDIDPLLEICLICFFKKS